MTATKHPVERGDVEYIIRHLRERDRTEIFALRWDDDEEKLASEVMTWSGAMTWVWRWNGVPVSLQGAWPVRPGVWSCWAFGTDQWPRVVLAMTKHSRRFIIPALLRARFHRAEAVALATHRDSRRWIEALGAREEGMRRGVGRHGEDFIAYVWTPQDVARWVDREQQRPGAKQRMLAVDGQRKAGSWQAAASADQSMA